MVIRLFCAAGMSTSLLVKKMEEAAKEKGKDVDIVAYPFTEMERVIEGVDVALLGPQVGYQLARAKEICDPKGVPVDVIPMQDGLHMIVPAYANSTQDNEYMTREQAYHYYNEFLWPERYADCVPMDRALELLKK